MSSNRATCLLLVSAVFGCTSDSELSDGPTRDERTLPRLGVVRAKEPPRLDGSLDDAAWRSARRSRAFVETREGGPASFQTFAKLLWDRQHLYLAVEVQDAWLRASHTEHDSHLWEEDCVEVMLDPDGDGQDYFEVQVSPRGIVFDTRYETRRVPKPFGHVDWASDARVGVSRNGAIDDANADVGYTVEMSIPWQAFSLDDAVFVAPEIGDEWRANFYVMDRARDAQRAAAWSPLGVADFHVPQRFGILTFEGTVSDMQGHIEPSTKGSVGQRLESPGDGH
jgi:hypothetical protein